MARTSKHGWPAAVLKAYAASIGKDVRTAQRHALADHPDFQRFARGMAAENVSRSVELSVPPPVGAESAALSPPDAPQEVRMDDESLSETGRMLKAAWIMWYSHYREWITCRGGYKDKDGSMVLADHPMMLMHAKLLIDLRKAFNDAFTKHQAWLVDNRRLIPVNEFHAFRSEFLLPVTNLMRNMPAEAAPLMNPQNQQQAIKGGTEWLQNRFMPAVQRLLDGLKTLAPMSQAA